MARPVGHPDNVLISRLASAESWSQTTDRAARTAPARQASRARFLTEARERFGDLPAAELAQRAEQLEKAHYLRMALRSKQARRAKRAAARKAGAA